MSIILLLLVLGPPLVSLLLLLVYLKFNETKFRNKCKTKSGKPIPGPSVFKGFSNLLGFNFLTAQITNKIHYGNVYASFLGTMPIVSISDAEIAKKMFIEHRQFAKSDLLSSDQFTKSFLGKNVLSLNGDEWRKVRMIMNPSFAKLDDVLLDKFVQKTRETLQVLTNKMNKSPQGINVSDDLQSMTLDIIGLTAFGYDFGSLARQDGKMSKEVAAYNYLFSYSQSLVWHLVIPGFFSLPLPSNLEAKKQLKVFNGLMMNMIQKAKERVAKEHTATCLLDLMCSHVDEETNEGLTDEELRANTVILFIAGHETTANALNFAFYVLAKHPEIQEKLYQEIKRHTSHITSDELMNCDAVNNIEYLNNFIKETMRQHPPVVQIPIRTSQKEDTFDGYTIPKNTNVGIHVYNIHHDERYWKDPSTFDPDRFLPENSQGRPFYAFIPFGGGPRSCIGNNFSLLEQRVFLTMLLKEFKVEMADPNYKLQVSVSGVVAAPVNHKVRLVKRT